MNKDEFKKQRNAVLNCIFGAKMIESNLHDTKGTIFYNAKFDKELQRLIHKFETQVINRADGARLEMFHTMNNIATLISRITGKDFNNLNIIYELLAAYDRGEVEMVEEKKHPSEGFEPSEGLNNKVTNKN